MVYWGVKSRGWPAAILAREAKYDLVWDSDTANAWPKTKGEAPFGQLPYIKTADGKYYAQSGALYRIIARKGGIDGYGNDHDFALNQEIIEEYQDMYAAVAKPLYVPAEAKAAAVKDVLEKHIPHHLGHFESLVGANGRFSSNRLLVGDILVICGINIVLGVSDKALANFPKLAAFYQKYHKEVLGEFENTPQYVKF